MSDASSRSVLKRAFTDSVPVLMGYAAMGFAAGVLLAMHGNCRFPALWGAASAASSISGTVQFLIPGWFNRAAHLRDVLILTFCINFRYAMYGFSLLEKFRPAGFWRKCYLVWTLTDETYALETASKYTGGTFLNYCTRLAAMNQCYWICGVTAGALTGTHLPFSGKGIDFAMTALFLVILTDQCREKTNRRPAIAGGLAALAGLLLCGVQHMLIPSIVLALASFLLFRKKWQGEETK